MEETPFMKMKYLHDPGTKEDSQRGLQQSLTIKESGGNIFNIKVKNWYTPQETSEKAITGEGGCLHKTEGRVHGES